MAEMLAKDDRMSTVPTTQPGEVAEEPPPGGGGGRGGGGGAAPAWSCSRQTLPRRRSTRSTGGRGDALRVQNAKAKLGELGARAKPPPDAPPQ